MIREESEFLRKSRRVRDLAAFGEVWRSDALVAQGEEVFGLVRWLVPVGATGITVCGTRACHFH
jgi:hypothetical protein